MLLSRWAKKNATSLLWIQNVAWLLLALWILPRAGHILYDEAYYYDKAVAIARTGIFSIYGPQISSTDPTAYTPGGGLYLLLAPAFMISASPMMGTAWCLILSTVGNLVFDDALRRVGTQERFRLIVGTLLVWSEWHARGTDRIWNVSVFWFLSLIMLSLTLRAAYRVGSSRLAWPLLGVIIGLCLQVHLGSLLLVVICAAIFMSVRGRAPSVIELCSLSTGFILVYLPYIAGEWQHHWQNTRAILGGVPARSPRLKSILRGVAAIFRYCANLSTDVDNDHYRLTRLPIVAVVQLALAAVLYVSGCLGRSPLRYASILLPPLVALFFFLNQREMYDHYLGSVRVVALIGLGLGLDRLADRLPRYSIVALIALWSAYGSWQWASMFYRAIEGNPISAENRLRNLDIYARNGRVFPAGDPGYEDFVYWVLARRTLGFQPTFHDAKTGKSWNVVLRDFGGAGNDERQVGPSTYLHSIPTRPSDAHGRSQH